MVFKLKRVIVRSILLYLVSSLLPVDAIQLYNQQKNYLGSSQRIDVDTATEAETQQQQQIDEYQKQSESEGADAFIKAEEKGLQHSSQEDQAMFAFSQAMAAGENVMDLPDKPQEEEPILSDEQATLLFQEHVNVIQEVDDSPKPKVSDEEQSLILDANFESEKVAPKPVVKPTEIQSQAQAAIDEVSIVIPDGMSVRSHRDQEQQEKYKQPPKDQSDNSDSVIEQLQANDEDKQQQSVVQEKVSTSDDSQAALDAVDIKDPFAVVQPQKESKPKIADHLLDEPAQTAEPEEQPYEVSKLLSDSSIEAKNNAQAAIQDVKVTQISSPKQAEIKNTGEPLMPKSLNGQSHIKKKDETEIERSIRLAENTQSEEEIQQEQEDNLDAQITGSGNMWESQIQVGMITEQITRPKNYKTPEQIKALKKKEEKLERQKIREELLAPDPVSEMDIRMYSGSLADKSVQSKSEIEIQDDKAASEKKKQQKLEIKRKQKEENEQIKLKKQQKIELEEQEQIRQGNLARAERKNSKDQQNIQDLKALDKLDRASTNGQIEGLTSQAASEEQDRQTENMVTEQVNAIEEAAEESPAAMPDFSNLRKVKELSNKLGIPQMPGDAQLGSKEKIAEVMVQRAIDAGKSQSFITNAMT